MKQINHKKRLKGFLKKKKMKSTLERFEILDALLNLGCIHGKEKDCIKHFNADDILKAAHEISSPVSISTIYRFIPILVDAEIIREIGKLSGKTIYELILNEPHHDHLLCSKCGKIIEFFSPELERIQNKVCRTKFFLPSTHSLCIKGLCKDCRQS
ncbi:MAG: transcriptional repressor [Verrucomicrobiota bacterium]|nr:transcriptional repressor [Verrucomicrobiota bacterium]